VLEPLKPLLVAAKIGMKIDPITGVLLGTTAYGGGKGLEGK
jgi:hypothetical protein